MHACTVRMSICTDACFYFICICIYISTFGKHDKVNKYNFILYFSGVYVFNVESFLKF
jgi:hypothetical protein